MLRGAFIHGAVILLVLTCPVAWCGSDVSDGDTPTQPTGTTDEPVQEENAPHEQAASSFIDLYERGVQSYLTNEWEDCVYLLELSLEYHRNYYTSIADCRIECEYAAQDVKYRNNFLHATNVENLHFYELVLRRTLCLSRCGSKYPVRYLPFRDDFDGHYMDVFQGRKPYTYLYACYIRTNQVTLAASAALTYLVKHPSDTVMKKNFEASIEKPGVDKEEIRDMEEKKFVDLLIDGIRETQDEHWEAAAKLLETSLMQFIYDENQCRAYCEGEYDHGFLPDFISSIGNHFAHSLYCKRNCTNDMGMVRGKYYENLFASHFQYLQTAYHKVQKYQESYRSGMSYLLFHPDDLEMLERLKTIEAEAKTKINENFFKLRREAIEYNERNLYEKKLIKFIDTEFTSLDHTDSDASNSDDEEGEGTYSGYDDVEDEYLESETPTTESQEPEELVASESTLYQPESIGYSQRDEL